MLRASPEVGSHILRQRQVIPLRICMYQRPMPLPVFSCGLGVKDERVGVRPLADRVGFVGQMIGRFRVGKRKSVSNIVAFFVLLARLRDNVGEAVVHPHQSSTGDMAKRAIENLAAFHISVETPIDRVTDASPRLRTTPAIGFLYGVSQRIDITGGIFGVIFEKAHKIPNRYMAKAENLWIASCIHYFVNPARLKPGG